MHTVAVYGTLKRGHGNNVLLQNETTVFVGTGVIKEDNFHLFGTPGGGFPVLLKVDPDEEGAYETVVEVYKVDDRTLASLDRLESEGYMYNREQVLVELSNQDRQRVYTYVGVPSFWEKHYKSMGSAAIIGNRQVWY